MITDNSNGKLAEIRAFAKENNLEDSFNKTFSRFENYSDKGFDVILYSDFAPLSLEFVIKEKERFVLNGGFIYHGKHDGNGNGGYHVYHDIKAGWSIHT